MKDVRKEKLRDLRRIARSDYTPSILGLFDKYHPEIVQWDDYPLVSPECREYANRQYAWAEKMAGGYWQAIGGSPPSWFRRQANRHLRTRQKVALVQAIEHDDLEDFFIPSHKRTINYDWW